MQVTGELKKKLGSLQGRGFQQSEDSWSHRCLYTYSAAVNQFIIIPQSSHTTLQPNRPAILHQLIDEGGTQEKKALTLYPSSIPAQEETHEEDQEETQKESQEERHKSENMIKQGPDNRAIMKGILPLGNSQADWWSKHRAE